MTKTIIAVILVIALISLTSAMYSGDCFPVDLNEIESLDNVIYDVVGNSSNLDGLTIDLNGAIASVCTSPDYKPDNFTIVFIDDSTKEVIREVCSGGGSSRRSVIKYVPQNNTVFRYINNTIYDDGIPGIPEEVPEEILGDFILGYIIAGVLAIILLLSAIVYIKFKKN